MLIDNGIFIRLSFRWFYVKVFRKIDNDEGIDTPMKVFYNAICKHVKFPLSSSYI